VVTTVSLSLKPGNELTTSAPLSHCIHVCHQTSRLQLLHAVPLSTSRIGSRRQQTPAPPPPIEKRRRKFNWHFEAVWRLKVAQPAGARRGMEYGHRTDGGRWMKRYAKKRGTLRVYLASDLSVVKAGTPRETRVGSEVVNGKYIRKDSYLRSVQSIMKRSHAVHYKSVWLTPSSDVGLQLRGYRGVVFDQDKRFFGARWTVSSIILLF
jgi:hypothetical protein